MSDSQPEPPGWPPWLGFAAFAATLAVVIVVAGVISGLADAAGSGGDTNDEEVTLLATFVQAVALVGFALLFARFFAPPREWHFGLRRAEPRTIRWLIASIVAFYAFAVAYAALLDPGGEQSVAEDVGADEDTVQLVLAGLLIVGVAPVVEEFFFRGLLFGALRQSLSFLPSAALAAVVFGLIHYNGPDTLDLLPVLAVLGFFFCFVYERTRSLYPAIAFHALNNAIAFPVAVGGDTAPWLSAGVGLVVITASIALALRGREAPSPLRSRTA